MSIGLKEYNRRLEQLVGVTAQILNEEAVFPAANRLNGKIINRVTIEGKRSDGTSIGTYSKKPMYATKEQFVRTGSFKPQGKKGKKKSMKSMYLPEGYFQLRQIQGRETRFKNYYYTGDLVQSFRTFKEGQTTVIGFNSEKQYLKRKGLQEKDGKVWYASQNEMSDYNKEVVEISKEVLAKPFL